jgi:hypothetical protein
MAEQPGVQGLHAAEVRNLDEFRIPRLRVHQATPQDQDTTVPAGPETTALFALSRPPMPGGRRAAHIRLIWMPTSHSVHLLTLRAESAGSATASSPETADADAS